jgi:hypothetical protein
MTISFFYFNSNEPKIGFWGGKFLLNIYRGRHVHFISSFEGERKKFQFGKFIQEVINMHHLSIFLFN